MCASCVHRFRDCSGLPFDSMPTMYREGGFMVVLCAEYRNGQAVKPGIADIDSVQHTLHATGFLQAVEDRAQAYRPDPAPRIHRTAPQAQGEA